MKALTYSNYGDPTVLEIAEVDEPHAGPGQVRIAVKAAGVNPWDWKLRSGAMQEFIPLELPAIPGIEAAGVVDEVGDGVEGVTVGDEVFGSGQRTSAEYAVLDLFAKRPAGLTWEQAGATATAAETSIRVLELVATREGGTLLIDGAAGGVGSAAAQIAVAQGLNVIGTASAANHDYLRSLGVVPTTYGNGLPQRVAELAPAGVDSAIDIAGKGSITDLVEITGSPDRVATIANPGAEEHGVRVSSGGEGRATHALGIVAELVEAGRFTTEIDSAYPLEDGAAAHQRSETGHVRGKIVLRVS